MKNVKSSLQKISKDLDQNQKSRNNLLEKNQDIFIIVEKAIINIHQKKIKIAKQNLSKSTRLLKKIQLNTTNELKKYLINVERKMVCAYSLIAIYEKKQIPSYNSLSVLKQSYVLGLIDCIIELKRVIYDNIRIGQSYEAERIFEIMENLYLILYPFSKYDKIINEVRKKLDYCRIVIENARQAVTEEMRRNELITTVKQ